MKKSSKKKTKDDEGQQVEGWNWAPVTANYWNECEWCEEKPMPLYFRIRSGETEYACKTHALANKC